MAEQHAELLVRDASVTGLRSVYMCQRFLEKADLTLRSAIETADALETALHNADAVQLRDSPPVPASEFANATASRNSTNSLNPTTAAARRKPELCYFCGVEKHPQKRCPVREATCSSCGMQGHFAKVCKSKLRAGSGSAAAETWGPPSCMPRCERPSLSASVCPAPDLCETWGLPSCMPRCGRPFLSASAWPAPDPPVFTGHQNGSTLATVTLDQSAPHHLARSMMDILVEGHRTSCLFDTGSTGSFIDPDTVQRCGLMTRR
ncbi:uncharacterized protein LOC132398212 [Hypanus sabinus]|uniref:uncharacterized protein LOC132398212 n=1 Tax=Hypanus sabinus TaxID=79690 RepID=UPI0028C48263|nr:uncharacterized protein LOC132398212 [Hypanus sabinus]XP_059833300.1 uncharacterized protein LOC132398212 [Hypanus sabinus]XP_059833301.1 uncharacterized protein LOC132398212 [Hypanus sabinus]XP_059833302.1 uncharacterized protein LOC132398212 [Hypanus sabinus]